MPGIPAPPTDPATRRAQIKQLFDAAIANGTIDTEETAAIASMRLTAEEKKDLKGLFDAAAQKAREQNTPLAVVDQFKALIAPPAAVRIDQRPIPKSPYVADLDQVRALFTEGPAIEKFEDLLRVHVDLGPDLKWIADTHRFDGPINIIPYGDEYKFDSADKRQANAKRPEQVRPVPLIHRDATGKVVKHPDSEIARYFPPGEVGFAIKHHRYNNRTFTKNGVADKENAKLQDTHVQIVVGVRAFDPENPNSREGRHSAITINSPRGYQGGQFGDYDYPMIFVRPKFPSYLTADQVKQYHDNIRTMLVGFNTISTFPDNYNGGDPLGARTVAETKRITAMMIRAIAGDTQAAAWFKQPENYIYCGELAHIATTAGILFPLNRATWANDPMVGPQLWKKFEDEVRKSQRQDVTTSFIAGNINQYANQVKLMLAPETLKPMPEYAPPEVRESLKDKLAFKPMTMADIIQHFIRKTIPRESFGEEMGAVQAGVLKAMKPALLEEMGLHQLDPTHPRRKPVEALFQKIVEVLEKNHGTYPQFEAALKPLLDAANNTLSAVDGGKGLFAPPSMFHVIAEGKHPGGLIELEPVGYGLGWGMVKPRSPTP